MTVFFTSSRFQEFCMSYYQLSFGSKCLLKGLMFNQFGQVDIITSSSMLQYHKKSLKKVINIIIIYNAILTTNSFTGESANSIYFSSYSNQCLKSRNTLQ